jgi:uncharacterized protein
MTIQVPFKEGLFKEIPGNWVLTGCQCKQCGQIFFPPKTVCLNCLSSDLQSLNLSTHGQLYSYTVVYLPSEHFPSPYTVGWVQLPEGIRVFSQIRGWQEKPLTVGMEMQMQIEKLWGDGEKEVTGYVFRPAGIQAGSDKR